MKIVNISTKSNKYVKTNIQVNEINPTYIKIKVLPPLKSDGVDYYIIQYVDKMNRRYESKKLYIDNDDYIIDELTRPLKQTTELNVVVCGYCKSEDAVLYKSLKTILLLLDKNMQYSVKTINVNDNIWLSTE